MHTLAILAIVAGVAIIIWGELQFMAGAESDAPAAGNAAVNSGLWTAGAGAIFIIAGIVVLLV
jgi:hypothetical protein